MPRILIVYDSDGDPWSQHAHDIKQHSPPSVSVTAMSSSRLAASPPAFYQAILSCSWAGAVPRSAERVGLLLSDHSCEFSREDKNLPALVACSFMRCSESAKRFLPQARFLLAVNERLSQIGLGYCPETYHCPVGINTRVFKPLQPIAANRTKLVVGWRATKASPWDKSEREWIFNAVQDKCREFCVFRVLPPATSGVVDRHQLARWYNDLDVLLHTGSTDGQPLPVYEALACGRPVVSTNVGDLVSLATEGGFGHLVGNYCDKPSGEAVIQKICDRLQELTSNRHHLGCIGKMSRRIVEQQFSWEHLAPRWLDYIVGLC